MKTRVNSDVKNHLRWILICLVLGAVINVLVAWICAAWSSLPLVSFGPEPMMFDIWRDPSELHNTILYDWAEYEQTGMFPSSTERGVGSGNRAISRYRPIWVRDRTEVYMPTPDYWIGSLGGFGVTMEGVLAVNITYDAQESYVRFLVNGHWVSHTLESLDDQILEGHYQHHCMDIANAGWPFLCMQATRWTVRTYTPSTIFQPTQSAPHWEWAVCWTMRRSQTSRGSACCRFVRSGQASFSTRCSIL